MNPTHLCCPVCRAPLQGDDKQLRCGAGHSFDRARQGYWNLLLAHRKRSREPGDNAEMVQARHRFLEAGHYRPLSQRINRQLLARVPAGANIVDMGCGEGYYTARLETALATAGKGATLTGLDISKAAVRAACRRSKGIHWLVASGAAMPLPDASVDILLVLFSRLMPQAFAELIKPGGHLLLAWPGADHLIELRRLIYREVRGSGFDPAGELAPLFAAGDSERVRYPFVLDDPQQISDLLAMTPHSRRLSAEARARLAACETLQLTLDVNIGVFQRR